MNKQQKIAIAMANLEYLENAKDEIFELFESVRREFDGSEYQQGKKDGLRLALSLLGIENMAAFNRGGPLSRDNFGNGRSFPTDMAGQSIPR